MLNIRLGYIALISALFISSIAIYFSVAGLAAIFSAYATSIIVMGTSIEVGKLVAVIWLHYNYKDKNRLLVFGMALIVAGVMFITSMGIFGYLSKSHVEQTAQSQESVAQVDRIEAEIARNNAIIARSEQKIRGYEDNGSGVDAGLNAQIDKEQQRIDSAYDRVKPVIQVQLDIIATDETKTEGRTVPYKSELDAINKQLGDLQTALNKRQIRTAQGIVGTKPDGSYKGETEKAIKAFRERNEARRDFLLGKIDDIRGTPSAATAAAQQEINRIRASVQTEIDESNATIKSLRARMGKSNANDIETLIAAEHKKNKQANAELDTLTEQKYELEASTRKLEAEVGPIKYIAEFVYGQEADANLLEKAVTWLIILIIFVFDPFAVLLLIAAQHSFDRGRAELKELADKEEPKYTMDELLKDYPVEELVEPLEPEPPEPPVETEVSKVNFASKEQIDWEDAENGVYEATHGFDEDIEEVKVEEPEPEEAHSINEGPWKDLNELSDIAKDLRDLPHTLDGKISLTKVGENYINFNGKVFRTEALIQSFPSIKFDFEQEVKSGTEFPVTNNTLGRMFLRTDLDPTHLYIFNGRDWDGIDKNVLNFTAYSHEYIKALIKRVGNGTYNPGLLNEAEKQHIEDLLGRD